MTTLQTSPISFPVDVRRLPQKGFPLIIEPDASTRGRLAAAHGLLAIEAFRAELLLKNWKRGGISVTGRVEARIVQECVVTLEPLETSINEEIDTLFVPEGSELARETIEEGELVLSADGPDLPETFDGATIDAGALAEEIFALGIDPYPRKPGAEIPHDNGDSDRVSPFAKLRDLRRDE